MEVSFLLNHYFLRIIGSFYIVAAGSTSRQISFEHLKHCNAQFTLAGIFPLHDEPDSTNTTCSSWSNKLYLQSLFEALAMIYAVIEVNNNENLLPGMPIAVDLIDSCNNVNTVISNYLGLDFVQDFYNEEVKVSRERGQIFAIIGSTTTAMGISLSTLSNVFNVPVISHLATSPVLANEHRFRSFLRTVPSDELLIKALIDYLVQSNWDLISVVYTKTDYATSAFLLLTMELRKRIYASSRFNESLCIVSQHQILNSSNKTELRLVFQKLKSKTQARVIINLAHWQDSLNILQEALSNNFVNNIWILSDGLSESCMLCRGADWEVFSDKIIVINMKKGNMSKFANFVEENIFKSNNSELTNLLPLRKEEMNSVRQGGYKLLDNLPVTVSYVIDAVMAAAHALHGTMSCDEDKCLNSSYFDQRVLLKKNYLANFTSQLGEFMSFNKHGDTTYGSYVFKAFWNDGNESMFYDTAEWKSIGAWKGLNMINNSIQRKIESKCRLKCQKGFAMKRTDGCCWKCIKCTGNEYSSEASRTCEQCPNRQMPDKHNTKCLPLKTDHFSLTDSTIGVIILCFSSIGLFLVLCISVTFYVYRKTHIVRASNIELTSILLIGIALGFITPLATTTSKSKAYCGLLIYMNGISMSLMLGSLFTKANRMYRIFRKQVMRGGTLKFMTIKWQLLTTFTFVAVEIFLATVIVFNPSNPIKEKEITYKTLRLIRVECDMDLWTAFCFLLFGQCLNLLCTYQAFLARKVPGEYNDSRSIFAITLVLSLENIIYISLLFSGDWGSINRISMSIPGVLSATTILVSLFGYKVYVILLQPHLNKVTLPHGSLGTFGSMRKKKRRGNRKKDSCKHEDTVTTDIGMVDIQFPTTEREHAF